MEFKDYRRIGALGLLSFLAFAAPAEAISRYNAARMTCDQTRSAILNEGAVILRYGSKRVPGLTLYDRYVASSRFCALHEWAERVYVPTADTRSCPVRACRPKPDPEDLFGIFP